MIQIQNYLNKYGFIKQSKVKFLIDEDSVWKKKDQYVVIGKGKFNLWANMAEVGLSNAELLQSKLLVLEFHPSLYPDLDHNSQNHLQKGNQDYWAVVF